MRQVILTKDFKSIEEGVKAITKQVKEGYIVPTDAYLKLKYLAKATGEASKAIEDEAIEEIRKHGEGEIDYLNCKIQVKNSATRYDFTNIGEVTHLEAQLKAAKLKYKELLKTSENDFIDESSGEIIALPLVKKGKTIVSVKYPKSPPKSE
mgnify:CR=1 FL=1